MALIKCPDCGKEFSNKAPACPNCGCPVSETQDVTDEDISLQSIWDTVPEKSVVSSPHYKATGKIGPVQIDESNRSFRIHGAIAVNGKKSGIIGSTFKGAMALGTLGMSVAAGKALGLGKKKVGSKEWYSFDDLISYELIEDDSLVTSGGVGQAIIGGAVGSAFGIGGAGAIAGGITGKRTQKKKVESLYIKATLNDFDNPCVMIPLLTKPTKTNSKEYQSAFNTAHQILSIFDVITHNK